MEKTALRGSILGGIQQTAIRSFRLPTPKLTIRLAVAVKTQESRIPFNYKEFIMEESSNKSVSVRPVPFLT